jgi:hypothetical protein
VAIAELMVALPDIFAARGVASCSVDRELAAQFLTRI